ncbi:MAG: ACT domain-containing protein [Acidimicrobiales bacterium]
MDDLRRTLASLNPRRRPGEFVVVSGVDARGAVPAASVVEDEGVTLVLARTDADDAGVGYDFVAAWITLGVETRLDAVGLTAVVATALADHGISCNVLAGLHHDHLLVPVERAGEAMDVLDGLARSLGA